MNKLELVSWILRGSQRRVIFGILEGRMIPAQIFQKVRLINKKITRNNVSDVLREMRENNLVECLNPNEKKGRIYQLTKKGLEVKKEL
jgi:ArsR family transcriptional regulator, cadmium/lead-responsive transcriptional repressor